jgi:hypothetical protein
MTAERPVLDLAILRAMLGETLASDAYIEARERPLDHLATLEHRAQRTLATVAVGEGTSPAFWRSLAEAVAEGEHLASQLESELERTAPATGK